MWSAKVARVPLLGLLILAVAPAVLFTRSAPVATSAFYLPATPGVTLKVEQGNDQGDHQAANGSQYAFDFSVGISNFNVAAAQGGKVIGVDDSSEVRCDGLDHEVEPNQVKLPGCWTRANYVLIANDDGTAALYLHLLPHSARITLGKHITRGTVLALAGKTGWATGVHLHFQVEALPSPAAQKQKKPGWWWTQSKPISFANPEVLAQDADGVPLTNQQFPLTGNTGQAKDGSTPTAPAPAPTPTRDPLLACRSVPGFEHDSPAAPVGDGFTYATAPLPRGSVGHVDKVYSTPPGGGHPFTYDFKIVDVCSPAISADGVRAFFAQHMLASGLWYQSDTFPYNSDESRACGDPYCWFTAGDPQREADTHVWASLESIKQAKGAVTYQVRTAFRGMEIPGG